MNKYIKVDAKLYPKDILTVKNKLIFNDEGIGFLCGMIILMVISYASILFKGGSIENVMQFFQRYRMQSTAMFIFIAYIVFALIKNYMSTKKEFGGMECKEVEYLISEFGISVTAEIENNFAWRSIHAVEENKKYFYIYINKKEVFTIPKSDFKYEQEIYNARRIIESKLESKKLQLKK